MLIAGLGFRKVVERPQIKLAIAATLVVIPRFTNSPTRVMCVDLFYNPRFAPLFSQ
jgi:hypothetical protein